MGIPSYYKKLVTTVKGLTGKSVAGAINFLWFDYNCLVYHVLRTMRPYVPDQQTAWEAELIAETVKYTRHVIQSSEISSSSPETVFLGIDGIVPAAKVNQQRRRRWNSLQTLEEERRLGKQDGSPVWDRNALTPGTHFMDALSAALTAAAPGRWTLSSVHEPGEGEHKIMERLRAQKEKEPRTHVIYGLDADLILLALYHLRYLHPQSTLYLMREDEKSEGYSYLNINKLSITLTEMLKRTGESPEAALTDYIFAMTLLGNDFLPHGLALALKGDGYEHLTRMLRDPKRPMLITQGSADKQSLQWNPAGLAFMFRYYAALEEGLITDQIQHKREGVRRKVVHGEDENEPWARVYSHWMKTPARRMDEYALVSDVYEDCVQLKGGWQRTYYKAWFGTTHRAGPCEAYIQGLHWVLRYYTGQSVNPFWYYPWNLPPLYEDLSYSLSQMGSTKGTTKNQLIDIVKNIPEGMTQLTPVEQCALVMPAASLGLCKDKRYHVLPKLIPHFYPSACRLFYVGKHQMWECEPLLPMLTAARLRALIKA